MRLICVRITSGRGEFQMEFSHYEELPAHLGGKSDQGSQSKQSGGA